VIHPTTLVLTPQGFKRYDDLGSDTICSVDPVSREQFYERPALVTTENYKGATYRFRVRNVDMVVTPQHPIATCTPKSKKVTVKPAHEAFFSHGTLAQYSGYKFAAPRRSTLDVEWAARMIALGSIQNDSIDYDEFFHAKTITQNLVYADARVWVNEFIHWNVKLPVRNRAFLACTSTIENSCRALFHQSCIRGGYHSIDTYKKTATRKMQRHAHRREHVILNHYLVKDGDAAFRSEAWSIDHLDGLCYNIYNSTGLFIAYRFGRTFLMSCERSD
jgi:hypothetical protein